MVAQQHWYDQVHQLRRCEAQKATRSKHLTDQGSPRPHQRSINCGRLTSVAVCAGVRGIQSLWSCQYKKLCVFARNPPWTKSTAAVSRASFICLSGSHAQPEGKKNPATMTGFGDGEIRYEGWLASRSKPGK